MSVTWQSVEAVATDAVAQLGPRAVRTLVDRLRDGWPEHALVQAVPTPEFATFTRRLLAAQQAAGWSDAELAAYLSGLATGYAQHAGALEVEPVWTGPSSHRVPVRATAPVLVDLVEQAQQELILMTYAAVRYPPLVEALTRATARGVTVDVVVETCADGGLTGPEPALAFADVPGARLWHWPASQRDEPHTRMHAKVAVVDQRVLLVSSANLTQSGAVRNIEAGLLVRGGHVPIRFAEHVTALRARGVLQPLPPHLVRSAAQ